MVTMDLMQSLSLVEAMLWAFMAFNVALATTSMFARRRPKPQAAQR